MRYFIILILLLSCKNEPKKVIANNQTVDTAKLQATRRDTTSLNTDDPYQTGKDTVMLNKIINKIFNFPEVKAINKQINKNSNGLHGVSIMAEDGFYGDTSYYHFRVGDNSQIEIYLNIYDFLLEKKTGKIKAYDPLSDKILNLKDWRKKIN